jgi:hypothetical protein
MIFFPMIIIHSYKHGTQYPLARVYMLMRGLVYAMFSVRVLFYDVLRAIFHSYNAFFSRTHFFFMHITFQKKKRKDISFHFISFHFFFVLRENGGENTPRRLDNNVEEKKPPPHRFPREDDGSANYNNRQRR